MKEQLKSLLNPMVMPIKKVYDKIVFNRRLQSMRNDELKIVVGSSGIYEKGWIPSEVHILNLIDETTWERYFDEDEIRCILAEHVWEHLTLNEGKKAAQVCFKYLKKGGWLRVAVPDGFHSSSDYIDYVKPGGHGAGADDHKVLYNFKTFGSLFEEAGFRIELLEYFDENGKFHAKDWNKSKGMIHRSIRYDDRNTEGQPNYTSLIIDAVKT